MSTRLSTPDGSVTGVATGNVGTGTALDDTQVYSVDALASADHPDDLAHEVSPEVEPLAVAAPVVPARGTRARQSSSVVAVPRAASQPIRPRRGSTGGYPVGLLAAGAIVLVIVAGVLTMRDGGLIGGGGTGAGLAGVATFPPAPSFGAFGTAAPEPTAGDGKGSGHGHGHGPH